ncbi:MAG: IS701 family transposase [Bacteroidales bacterium]|nr:IS701 family transposase [Bacteroidales bacterium]
MAGIIEFPQVVQSTLQDFGDLFANAAQRRHFAEYLTGLSVADRKTICGINAQFAQTSDPSCLNRFFHLETWDVVAINTRRLELLQKDSDTRYSDHGVIPIDDTLIDHDGKLIDDVGWFRDHAEERHKIAHDYMIANYVCPSGKHYPPDFRCFQKQDQCEARQEPFQSHTELFQELVDWVNDKKIPGTFAMDSYFTNAPILNHIHEKKTGDDQPRGYVGSLKFNRKLQYKGRILKASELAAEIGPESRKPMQEGEKKQWYFTCTLRIPDVQHKVRIVILWPSQDAASPRIILVTNRVRWEGTRVAGVYRHRWTGTETFHRDGKQELGMGDCQLRSREGQSRHMYLVMLAYSRLMSQLKQSHAYEWAYRKLTTIGEACRAIGRETLRSTLNWAIERVLVYDWDKDQVAKHLGLTPTEG